MGKDPFSEVVVSAIEEWGRGLQNLGKALYGGKIGGMLPPFVLIDPRTRRKLVNSCADTQLLLGKISTNPRFL